MEQINILHSQFRKNKKKSYKFRCKTLPYFDKNALKIIAFDCTYIEKKHW